jgi:hypothetical protein
MSDKILNLLHKPSFKSLPSRFQTAVVQTAIRKGLISFDEDRKVFLESRGKAGRQILMGLL